MQKALKSGSGKASGEKSKAAAKDVPSQTLAKSAQTTEATETPRSTLSETAEKILRVRASVDEARRALDDLSFAFQEIGEFRLMSVVSDDATALAFAANVLSLGQGAKDRDFVLGSNEQLKFEFNIGRSTILIEKHASRSVIEVAEKSHVDFFVGEPDTMLAEPINAHWNGGDLDVHFATEDTLTLLGANKAGSIAMRYGDQVARLSMAKIPARFGLLDLAV